MKEDVEKMKLRKLSRCCFLVGVDVVEKQEVGQDQQGYFDCYWMRNGRVKKNLFSEWASLSSCFEEKHGWRTHCLQRFVVVAAVSRRRKEVEEYNHDSFGL